MWFHAPLLNTVITAIIVTGISYVIVDLWVLSTFGQVVATLLDGVLAGLTIWATQLILVGFGIHALPVLATSAILTVTEAAFHIYLLRAGIVEYQAHQ